MRQLTELHNVVIVEEGDTLEIIAHWIEDNLEPPLERGSVDVMQWFVVPTAGDIIIFDAGEGVAMMRYPSRVQKLPVLTHPEMEREFTDSWSDENGANGDKPATSALGKLWGIVRKILK